MKFRSLLAVISVLFIFVSSCKKKEEPKPEIPTNPVELLRAKEDKKSEKRSTDSSKAKQDFHVERHEIRIVVPENVKRKWDSVKLSIEDRKLKKTDIVLIRLGGEYVIPDSDLKVRVGEFLPDFRMDALTITSLSNNPNNPAVKVTIWNEDNEIFSGWLYAKFPTIHPFQHDRFGVTLKQGMQKK